MASRPVADLVAAVDAVSMLDVHALPDVTLVADLALLLEVETRLRAVQTAWLAAAETRDATVADSGRSTRSWLVEEHLMAPAEASRRMRLAKRLPAFPAVEGAFRSAEITAEHASVIVTALLSVPVEFRESVEAALLDLAREHPPFLVARAVDEILAALGIDDDSDEAHARRYSQRGLSLAETFGGTGSLSGTLTPEALEKLRLALRSAGAPAGPDDDRSFGQRMHDGMVELADFYLAHADLADLAGERPRVVVTVDLDVLLGRLAGAWATLDSGVSIAPETARRLACDAEVIPAVLGARGEVLDIGHASRTFTTAIKRAARLRDGNRCVYPKCGRRPVDCHHIVWWSHGGRTSLDNAAWLCAFHHWLVHEGGWTMSRDGDGSCTFTSPDRRQRSSPPRDPRAA